MKNWGLWFWDQKPDKFIYSIMKQRCESEGREIYEVDLNGEGIGDYAPFKNGTKREILDRFLMRFLLRLAGLMQTITKIMHRRLCTIYILFGTVR